MDLVEYLTLKYGKRFDGSKAASHLHNAGKKVNISFNEARRVQNTLRAHRLIELAKHKLSLESADALMEAIFISYFENAENINLIEVLVRISTPVFEKYGKGGEYGEEQLRSFLQGNEYTDSVLTQVNSLVGVRGVPYFVITSPKSKMLVSVINDDGDDDDYDYF